MESAQTLLQFISGQQPSTQEPSTFNEFLSSVKVVPLDNEYKHRISSKLKFRKDYKKYVKSLVAELLRSESDNVLISGLPKLHQIKFQKASSNLIYTSFVINELHTYNWKRVFEILGSERMTDLLTNWKGFIKKEARLIQIFGDRITYGQKDVTDVSNLIRKSLVFHHSQSRPRYWEFTLINSEPDQLMGEIFGENTKAKRFKRVRFLLKTIIEHDKACRYQLLYQSMLIGQRPINPHKICSNASTFQEVIRFVFVILGKLLSLEAWGGQENKTIIRKRVEEFLKLDSRGALQVHDIVKGLRLNDFHWLGTTSKVTSKQDFEIRQKLLQQYVHWLFSTIVRNIIRSFWFVAESADGEVFYFPRHIWHKISYLWLEMYSGDNLIKSGLTGQEKYNYGMLKLIPKKDTFRLICVPAKRSPTLLDSKLSADEQREQDIKFNIYRANVLRPVRLILQTNLAERRNIDPCYSTTASSTHQIAERILAFKADLSQKFPTMPKLYFVKFDMKECYDRMNQKKLIEKVISLFRDDKSDTKFYFRSVGKMRLNLKQQSFKHLASSNLADLDILSDETPGGNNSILVDSGKTMYLTRKEVITECIQQIFGAKCYIPDRKTQSLKFFRRKQGVFQGFSLSSIFCDILYSALVAEHFRFLWESDSPFFLTRLVDDFLFITPDVDQYTKVLEIISDGRLETYGAYVNKDKTQIVDHASSTSVLQFVGLEIEVDNLNVTTNYSRFGSLSTSNYRTFKDLLQYLKIAYTARLHDYMLSCEKNSETTVLKNISNLLSFILSSFNRSFQRISHIDVFIPDQFIKFLWNILFLTLRKFENCNHNSDFSDELLDSLMTTISAVLSHGPQYKVIVDKLKQLSLDVSTVSQA
ncbi:EST2 [Candida metapsilosis]|uniref:Telomerase reverse transcriptase n=1 Tax=Candida metapsilosis TaxID=273372 RepID=A0A8H7ZCQ0_9ASCO|nr:EST2 [Candida metapsilosis]